VVVLGGAKVSDKIALIDRFLDTADSLLIGGAMCFSFFKAQGKPTGDSLVEEEGVDLAEARTREGRVERLRSWCCRWTWCWATASTPMRRRTSWTATRCPTAGWASTSRPRSAEAFAKRVAEAGTVFWNGPMGAFELEPFAAGTRALAEAVCALLQDRTAAEAMGQRGRETARLYSWDRIAEQVVDFYVRTGTRTFPTYAAEALSTSGLAL